MVLEHFPSKSFGNVLLRRPPWDAQNRPWIVHIKVPFEVIILCLFVFSFSLLLLLSILLVGSPLLLMPLLLALPFFLLSGSLPLHLFPLHPCRVICESFRMHYCTQECMIRREMYHMHLFPSPLFPLAVPLVALLLVLSPLLSAERV